MRRAVAARILWACKVETKMEEVRTQVKTQHDNMVEDDGKDKGDVGARVKIEPEIKEGPESDRDMLLLKLSWV